MGRKEITRGIGYVFIAGGLFFASPFYNAVRLNTESRNLSVQAPSGTGILVHRAGLSLLRKMPCAFVPENLRKPYGLRMEGAEHAIMALPFSSLIAGKRSFDDHQLYDATKCRYPVV